MKFSSKRAEERFTQMKPRAQELAIEMDQWAQDNYKIELTLTETLTTTEEDYALMRKSKTHSEGRAFDIRVRDLSEDFIAKFCAYFRKKYKNLGAVSNGGHNIIVYKTHGTGPHFHVQIRRE